MAELHHIREIDGAVKKLGENENISEALITAIDLGTGVAAARVSLPREMFYRTLSEQSGFDVGGRRRPHEPADKAGRSQDGI